MATRAELVEEPAEHGAPAPALASEHARATSIMEAHVDAAWRTLRRLGVPHSDLDDAVQQVFMALARRIRSVEPGKERGFVLGVALRVAADQRRRRRRHPEDATEPALLERGEGGWPSPESALDEKQKLLLLDRVIGSLPQELATVFVLFELEGQTMVEIATMLELPPGTVASRLRRARERFEQLCRGLEVRR